MALDVGTLELEATGPGREVSAVDSNVSDTPFNRIMHSLSTPYFTILDDLLKTIFYLLLLYRN